MKELAKASKHCCCMKELKVKLLYKASHNLLAESALSTRDGNSGTRLYTLRKERNIKNNLLNEVRHKS